MTVILLRHGRSTSNTGRTLAGRLPGVELDELGWKQAHTIAERLANVSLKAIVHSPLLRCEQTITPLTNVQNITPRADVRLVEVDYGSWTGRGIDELSKEPLWPIVQQHPAAAAFPGGESLAAMQARSVSAIREIDAELSREHGSDVIWAACSHGDVIKAVVADAVGTHLDNFQRIIVEPGSVSIIRYTTTRPFLIRMNDQGGDLSPVLAPTPGHLKDGKPNGLDSESDATPGGSV